MTNWTQTYTGKRFMPTKPRTDDVDIDDIARALSMQCRFNGHIKRFYSVAEHSIIVSRIVEAEYEAAAAAQGRYRWDRDDALRANVLMAALLHDASEAYLGDMVKPVKDLPELEAFRRLDSDVQVVIEGAFIDMVPEWGRQLIHQADMRALGSEAEWLLMGGPLPGWNAPAPDPKLMPLLLTEVSPGAAERNFHARFDELSRRMRRWEP